jgi:hypothetical protein
MGVFARVVYTVVSLQGQLVLDLQHTALKIHHHCAEQEILLPDPRFMYRLININLHVVVPKVD